MSSNFYFFMVVRLTPLRRFTAVLASFSDFYYVVKIYHKKEIPAMNFQMDNYWILILIYLKDMHLPMFHEIVYMFTGSAIKPLSGGIYRIFMILVLQPKPSSSKYTILWKNSFLNLNKINIIFH